MRTATGAQNKSRPAERGQRARKGAGLFAQRGKSNARPALESSFALQIPLRLSSKADLQQPEQCSHLPTASDCSLSLQPAQPWPGLAFFFIKQLRVLLAAYPPSVRHVATRCHGNDRSLGDICCRRRCRSRVLLIGKLLPLLPRQHQRLGWEPRMLHAPSAKAGSCVGCAAVSASAESFSFLRYLLKCV